MSRKSVLIPVYGLRCLLLTGAVLMVGCAYHPPAPIEEQSDAMVKRQLNSDGTYYVRSGDTLYAIAFGYGVDPLDVANWNGISSPYTIFPGQTLRLSAPERNSRSNGGSSAVQITPAKTPGQASTRSVSSPVTPPKTTPAEQDPVQTRSPPVASTGKQTATTTVTKKNVGGSADPGVWKWPTTGRVLRTYLAGDPARNGLDIAGKEGQPVFASAAGQVVYSGNGLIGYGELIIIKHNEKMLSAYAHNKVRLVNEGEQVSAGQKIAEMGRNSSDEQVLHFEIRAHGKPVNPMTYLPAK